MNRLHTIPSALYLLLSVCIGMNLATPARAETFTTPGNWSFTVPANVYSVTVEVIGGGGGAGGYDVGQSANGGASAKITATIAVVPGQVLSGTVGQGGMNGFSGGTWVSGGSACAGSGSGGSGTSAGGAGGNANCADGSYNGSGYSGGGGGGGGASSLLINGSGFIIAGGGGGAGGGNSTGTPGAAGGNASSYTREASCGTGSAGNNGFSANFFDGSGGGGGGGGFAGGSGGAAAPDNTITRGGGAGTSCVATNNRITSISSGTGAAGGIAPTTVSSTSNGRGGNGSITITYSIYSGTVGRHQDCATEYGNGSGLPTTPASATITTTCVVPYSTTVRYYTQNTMGFSETEANSVECNNAVFGDPDFGTAKICAFDVIALTANQSTTNITATVGSAIPAIAPATGSLGLAPYSYAISPALPAGLSMNASTGEISGTPSVASASTTYTVTISDTANQSTYDAIFAAAGEQTSQSVTRTFTLTVNKPVSVTRAISLVSDPVNGTTNPKAIPGAILRFEITVSNSGTSALDDGTMFISDALPPQVATGASASPILTQSNPSSNLTFNSATDVAYSDSSFAPTNFAQCTYTPTEAFDPNVRYICFNPKGSMAGASGSAPGFTIAYSAKIE